MNSKSKKLASAGIVSAIAASLCCITPVLALISGASGIAASFTWMEPLRPYLIGISIVVLAFAWYQKLKPRSKDEITCDCDDEEKPSFIQSKLFLGIITVFAIVMTAFPYYASVFYPDNKKEVVISKTSALKTMEFGIEGMTCTACEEHVNYTVNELEGIVDIKTSFKNGKAVVEFDESKTSKEKIEKAINSTGYTVTKNK